MFSFLNIADVLVGVRQTTNRSQKLVKNEPLLKVHTHIAKRDGYLASHLDLPASSSCFHIFICLHVNGNQVIPSWFAFQVPGGGKKALYAKSLLQILHSRVPWTLFERKTNRK